MVFVSERSSTIDSVSWLDARMWGRVWFTRHFRLQQSLPCKLMLTCCLHMYMHGTLFGFLNSVATTGQRM